MKNVSFSDKLYVFIIEEVFVLQIKFFNAIIWFIFLTVDAVKLVTDIKLKREGKFIKDRQMKGEENNRLRDVNEVKQNMHFLRLPAADMKVCIVLGFYVMFIIFPTIFYSIITLLVNSLSKSIS